MASISEKLGALIERVDGLREDVGALRNDVASLKTDRDKQKGAKEWVAGSLAVVAVVLSMISLLTGCATLPEVHWKLPTVLHVDSSLPEECIEAVADALALYEAKGVDYVQVEMNEPTWQGFLFQPVQTITWQQAYFDGPVAGETQWARWSKDRSALSRAQVAVEDCRGNVARHEMGHALGLEHDSEPGNVMYWDTSGVGYDLDEDQIAWITWR